MKKKKLCVFLFVIVLLISACKSTQTLEPTAPNQQQTDIATTELPKTEPTQELSQDLPRGDLLISEIQGQAHISPYNNEEVKNVIGIVTTVSGEGFYVQSPYPDMDEKTSEGLFIYNPGLQKVKPGDTVTLSGKVIEHYPGGGQGELSITELVYVDYEILSNANPLPTPIIIGIDGRIPPTEVIDDDQLADFDPQNDGLDFYESLESMLIEIKNPISVAPINKYKELAMVPDLGENTSGLSQRGVLTISPSDFNPERILIDDALRSLPDDVPIGSTVDGGSLIGIVDYTFGMFKIQPTSKPVFIYGGIKPNSAPPEKAGTLRVASYNVENFDAEDKEERFIQFADQVVNYLNSPDLLILSEVQDNDGPLSSDVTAADVTGKTMAAAILSAGGPQYTYIDIAPKDDRDGGEPGGNIRVGFLYRTDAGLKLVNIPGGSYDSAVQLLNTRNLPVLSASPARIDPTNYAFRSSRKPLIAQFDYNGQTLFVIGMHMNSKGGDTPLFGQTQPPRLESEVQRMEQAEVLAGFIANILLEYPQAQIILAGDLNDYQFSAPLATIVNSGMINPISSLDRGEQYTYIYEGNAQALDHIMISPALNTRLTHFSIIHLNSEQPFRQRLSDHDAVLAEFTWDESN